MSDKGTILFVDDEVEIRESSAYLLRRAGYEVYAAEGTEASRAVLSRVRPDLIVLDIMLEDGDGRDFCREIQQTLDVPILFVSALDKDADIVAGLHTVGDDYLPKPFKFDVLEARVEALLRRASRVPETIVKGPLKLDIASSRAFLDGTDMMLTRKEFALLLLFIQHEDRTMSAEYLFEKLWKLSTNDDARTVKYHISNLRKKLSGSGYSISATRGEGYCFDKVTAQEGK